MDSENLTAMTWEAFLNWAAALSTPALALFAAVELWRGRKATARADAEVGAAAYALRRQLRSLLSERGFWFETSLGRIRSEAARIADHHLPPAEDKARAMVTAAGGASAGIARAAREGFALFYMAADSITASATGAHHDSPPGTTYPSEWAHGQEAEARLRACVDRLNQAIPRNLSRAARRALAAATRAEAEAE